MRYSAPLLLDVLLATLLERQLLIVAFDVASLMPAAAALCHLLSPLSFAGVFIPFLPAALHPEPETLVNHTPTPFIIGVEAQTLPLLQPLSEHLLLLDLDATTLSGTGAAELRDLARQTPCLQRLQRRLADCCEAEGAPELDERQLQACNYEQLHVTARHPDCNTGACSPRGRAASVGPQPCVASSSPHEILQPPGACRLYPYVLQAALLGFMREILSVVPQQAPHAIASPA